MNFLDRTIAVVAPQLALSRHVARQKLTAFSRFDAAKVTRNRPMPRMNMPAEQTGGTTERIRLMNRARDLDDNFSTVRAILTHFCYHIAGTISYQARTGDSALDTNIETYVRNWSNDCDITGRHNLLSLTQLVLRAVLVDGDCGILVAREKGQLKLQSIPADRIGRDIDLNQNDAGYVGGITIDDRGRPVSYRIYQRNSSGAYLDFVEQPAEYFCHVFAPTRLDEYRGRSVMATLLDDAADISDIIDYEKLAARLASSQAGVVKTEYGADEEMASVLRGDKDQFGNEIKLTALEPGRINYLNTGESMEVFKAGDRPAQAFQNFVQYLENRMCRAMGVSARVVLDRPSAGPEARKDLMQAERTFDFWRSQLESQFLNKVIRMVLMDAVVKGELPNDPNVTRGEWQWPGSVSIDAGRDARADIELWRTGLTTAAELYGENGRDWESSLRQRAKESAFISQLALENGVSTESISGGQPSVATDPNLAPAPSSSNQGDVTSVTEAAQSADSIQGNALNGAQVQALLELAQSVAQGLIPSVSAKAIASAAFPLIPSTTLDAIFDGITPGQSVSAQDVTQAAMQAQFAIPSKYGHINFKPTVEMALEAQRGLKWRNEFNRGGTMVGVARARDIGNRTNLSPDTIRRMHSYFARHEVDKQGQGFSQGEEGYPSAGRIAWALWGGDAGASWASARVDQMGVADDSLELAVPDEDTVMAIPTPEGGEDEQKFIGRCMGDASMNADYPDETQRAAVCYSSWKQNS